MKTKSHQLRGEALKANLRRTIEAGVAEAAAQGKRYKFVGKHVAETAGCSRTTLLNHRGFIDQVLAEYNGGKRTNYGTAKIATLKKRVATLEAKVATQESEIDGLRAERFEIYDRMVRGGVDIASVFGEF